MPRVAPTLPGHLEDTRELVARLREFTPADVASLMQVSDAIAALNVARYGAWSEPFTDANSRPAVLAFDGDVYDGLRAREWNGEGLARAQARLRILSGLYGVLRPLDLMQPYRLEMGTRLVTDRGRDLYRFWDGRITARLANDLGETGAGALLNLASDEYFRSVKPAGLPVPVVSPAFEDRKGAGAFKVVSFWAKRARGAMARWVLDEGVEQPADLRGFAVDGYAFAPDVSTDARPVFRRSHA